MAKPAGDYLEVNAASIQLEQKKWRMAWWLNWGNSNFRHAVLMQVMADSIWKILSVALGGCGGLDLSTSSNLSPAAGIVAPCGTLASLATPCPCDSEGL